MLENAAESHTSGARFVGWRGLEDSPFEKVPLPLFYVVKLYYHKVII